MTEGRENVAALARPTLSPIAYRRWMSGFANRPDAPTRRMLKQVDMSLVDWIGWRRTLRADIARGRDVEHRRAQLQVVEMTIRALFAVRRSYFRTGWW